MKRNVLTIFLAILGLVGLALANSFPQNVISYFVGYNSIANVSFSMLQILFSLSALLVTVAGFIFWARKVHLFHFTLKGLSWKTALVTGFGGLLAIYLLRLPGILVLQLEGAVSTANQETLELVQGILPPMIMIVMTVFAAPVIEEIMFRAYTTYYLCLGNAKAGLIVGTILFALFHLPTNFGSFIIYAGMGLCLGYVYYKTKRLEYAILLHFINNLIAVVLMYII
ncbi:CPBP family intramembrane glutamic endopeptidase [Streptococcus merionis]|uniref:CPBP family intramembrane glutamic endopeptidase n=1 Tax=Streptococcus merionis TaxID=400065 RepID=UPI0026EEF232|nr:type II CAAX endopeptidase family protein [Streptococcus merionis]